MEERKYFILCDPANEVVVRLTKAEYSAIAWLLQNFNTDIAIEPLNDSSLVEEVPERGDWDFIKQ